MNLADRLKPYRVATLIHKLERYEATRVPSQILRTSWATLQTWAMLLNEDDEGLARMFGVGVDIPDPDEWFGRVKV